MNADAQNQELMRLYRIRKTVLKMLTKRGYNVLEQTLTATFQTFSDDVARISLENNNCTAREACTINVGKIDDANDVVFVFFSDDEKVSVCERECVWMCVYGCVCMCEGEREKGVYRETQHMYIYTHACMHTHLHVLTNPSA